MSLSERIRRRRLDFGLTQLQLAHKLNMGRSNVGHIENGRTQPTSEVLVQIAEVLKTTTDYLLGRTDDPGSHPPGSIEWTLTLSEEEYLQYFKQNCPTVLSEIASKANSLRELIDNLIKIIKDKGFDSLIPILKHETLQDMIAYSELIRITFRINRMDLLWKNENNKKSDDDDDEYDDDKYDDDEYEEDDLIPLIGTISAGDGLFADQNIEEYIQYPFFRKAQPDFALRVKGDSMRDAGILDGDIVFLRSAKWAEFNGQIVAAIVGEDGILKRMKWSQDSPRVKLVPENADYQTLEVFPNEVQVCGVYMGFFRAVE